MLTQSEENLSNCTKCNYSCTTVGSLKMHSGKNFSAAHSVIVQPQQLVASRDTCWSIQKRSPSGVNCVTILALELNISLITSSHTLEKSLLHVSSVTILSVALMALSITCFHTLVRNLLPASNATTHANCPVSWKRTRESTLQKIHLKCNAMLFLTFALYMTKKMLSLQKGQIKPTKT